MYQLKITVKIVDLLFTVCSLSAGSVKPDVKDFAVARQKLGELSFIKIVVLICTVEL